MNLKTKSEIFDILYAVAQRSIHHYNPCGFKNGVCVYGKLNGCCSGRTPSTRYKNRFKCEYLDEDKGCTIQCLGCKLFYCTSGSKPIPGLTEKATWVFSNEMAMIREIATDCGISLACFCSKEKAINHPQTQLQNDVRR